MPINIARRKYSCVGRHYIGVAARGARTAGRPDASRRHALEPGRRRSGRQARLAAFLQGLQNRVTDGRNVQIDIRWGEDVADGFRRYPEELLTLAPDVIVASGS